ncbi:hypothetical protein MMC11_000113 [Xylographa trunciseda]|nr:hypothetical protein [Xylographa trunciseda]
MLSYLLFIVFGTVVAHPPTHAFAVHQVYDFPNPGSWIENLAVRSDGHILATRLDVPQLYEFSPLIPNSKPTLIHAFPSTAGFTGLTGITELAGHPDVFAFIAGNFSAAAVRTKPGGCAVWRVDMRQRTPTVSEIAHIPQASVPNGMASLDAAEHAVLISDSTLGNVWRLDLRSGAYTVAIDDPKMNKVRPNATESVNGIRIFGGYLYFTNSDALFFARIPIHANGTASGPSEIVAYAVGKGLMFDDFAIDDDGTAYVATGNGNVVTQITPDGRAAIIAGNLNSTELASPTSVQFGRTERDRRTIYVTTAGGLEAPINGTVIVGAQLASVDLSW